MNEGLATGERRGARKNFWRSRLVHRGSWSKRSIVVSWILLSGCGSSDESNLHDPALIVGTWDVPQGAPADQASVQSITYTAAHTYSTIPPTGAGQWEISPKLRLVMSCTSSGVAASDYCHSQTIVDFEVNHTELKWIWANPSSTWVFNRAP